MNMKVSNTIIQSIERYGDSIQIITDDETINTKAFVEELRYRDKVYIGGEYHKISKKEKYLYVGNPNYKLTEGKTIIKHRDNSYLVKSAEYYFVNDEVMYIWGILSLIKDDTDWIE